MRRMQTNSDTLAAMAPSPRVARLLGSPLLSRIRPSDAQAATFRKMSQVCDPLSDNLVAAMHRLPKGEGRRQFDQAVEHGIGTVQDPLPELVAFMEEVDRVPYWLDHRKIETAQHLMARIPMRTLTLMTIPGFVMTYASTRTNQVLIRTGGLDEGATSRIAETLAWLVACTQPGGMDRFGEGFKSCARVRLVHAYVRMAMNGLDEWDYDNWDYPVNQAQQAITLLPFNALPSSLLGLGHILTPGEWSAVMHLMRYMSHVVGVRPEMQIGSLHDLMRLTWLALWTEIKTDEFSPALTAAALKATYGMYELPSGLLEAPARWALYRLHADISVLTSILYSPKEMGLPPLSPMALTLPAIIGMNLASDVVKLTVPGVSRIRSTRGARRRKAAMDKIVQRSRADLTFDKSSTPDNVERKRRQAKRRLQTVNA